MLRPFAGLIWVVFAAIGCASLNPLPTNCWVGLRGEYRLLAADGGDAGAADVEEAAQIIHARVSRIGFANFEVRTRSDGVIEIDLPPMADPTELRELILPTGDLTFVPLPEGVAVEPGDPIPADLPPLFGREAVSSVRPGTTATGDRAIDLTLTEAGANALDAFAARNVGRQLGIVSDGIVLSAPSIQAAEFNGQIQLSGGPIGNDVNMLVTLLTLPPLPGVLVEVSFGPVQPPPACPAAI